MGGPAERSAPSVFVSYAREDDPFVQRLCRALGGRDHQAWIDQIDLHPFDPDWVSSVHSAIEACATFLVVISPESLTSKACAAELAHAVAHNKRLAPILYREVDEGAWSQTCPALGKPNWLLFRESDDFERSMQRLIGAIETDLEWAGAHARLLVRAKEWEKRVAGVLTLTELREAERWLDGAAAEQPAPLPLHTWFIHASRESADQELASRLLIHAEREAKGPAGNIVLSVLLALESYRLVPSPGALEALRRGLLLPRCIKVLHEPRRGVSYWSRIVISSDGRYVAINELGRVDVLEVTTGHRVFSLEFSPRVEAMCLSPSGRYLGTWRNLKELTESDPFPYGPFEVFRVSDGQRIASTSQSKIRAWAFSADERYLAAGGFHHVISLVDLETGRVTSIAQGKGTSALAFHPSGKILASEADDELFIWTLPDAKKCQRVRTGGSMTMMRFNDTGHYLLAAQQVGGVGYLHLWLVSRRWKWWRLRPVPKFSISSTIRALAFSTFSPAGFAVATEGGGVHVCWAGYTGNEPHRIDEEYRHLHDRSATALAFRPYDKAVLQFPGLVTSSSDGTAREWLTTDEIARAVHTSAVEAIAYSPDGRQIITATDEGGVYVWESHWLDVHEAKQRARRDVKSHDETVPWTVEQRQLEGDALIDEICRRLPRTFTIDEWRQMFGDEPYRVTCPGLPLT